MKKTEPTSTTAADAATTTDAAATAADDSAQLADAINNLASAIHESNRQFAEFRGDTAWASLPSVLSELNRRLSTLCTRL